MISRQKFFGSLSKAASDTIHHDGIEHAGYLAYLGLLSLFPFLVFFVALAGFGGEMEAGRQLIGLLLDYLPSHFIGALMPRIEEIISGPPPGLFTIAVFATIWTASSAVEGARTVLNRAYRVSTPPAYVWRRLMAIVQFLGITLTIFIAMFFLIFAPLVWRELEKIFHLQEFLTPVWTYVRLGLSVFVLGCAVGASYYVLPNIRQRWHSVIPGTIMVLFGWLLAAAGLSYYLERFQQLSFVYGSLEGIIVALLFFWASSVVYIFGAEFNYHFEVARGYRVISRLRGNRRSWYFLMASRDTEKRELLKALSKKPSPKKRASRGRKKAK